MVLEKISKSVGIIGTGSYVPQRVLSNQDLEKVMDTSDEWIRTRTGIMERRILEEGKSTSFMATEAGRRALGSAGVDSGEIDLIIVATVTPDMAFPSTACIIQENLKCKNAAALDIEAACSGFLYGLSMAYCYIKSGMFKKVLVIGAETLSRITDWTDRSTCVLFGDGAGAAVLGEVSEGKGILSIEIGADGSGADYLMQPAGGSRMPASYETVRNRLHYINMKGNEVFKFAVKTMEEASLRVIEKCNLKLEDIDFLVPHQANMRIIESARKRLKLETDKVYVNLDKYGNMSSASIPVALDEAVRENKIKEDDNVLLVGFGGGLTWGACIIKWHKQ